MGPKPAFNNRGPRQTMKLISASKLQVIIEVIADRGNILAVGGLAQHPSKQTHYL